MRLAAPVETYLHAGSALATMASLGYASWNERFELVLLVVSCEGEASAPVEDFLELVDKAQFERED